MSRTSFQFSKKVDGVVEIPSPSFGYSLYQLNPVYTDALTLRRLSDLHTEVIGFNGGFLNTSQAVSFLNGSEGTVVQWDDPFSGNHLLASSQAKEPKLYDTNGIITHNGTPALRLQNSNMESQTQINWTKDFVVYSLYKTLSTGTTLIVNADFGSGNRIAQILRSAYDLISLTGSAAKTVSVNQNPSDIALAISRRSFTDSELELNINEFSDSQPMADANEGLCKLRVGSFNGNTYPANGYLSEIQIFLNENSKSIPLIDSIKNRYNLIF